MREYKGDMGERKFDSDIGKIVVADEAWQEEKAEVEPPVVRIEPTDLAPNRCPVKIKVAAQPEWELESQSSMLSSPRRKRKGSKRFKGLKHFRS